MSGTRPGFGESLWALSLVVRIVIGPLCLLICEMRGRDHIFLPRADCEFQGATQTGASILLEDLEESKVIFKNSHENNHEYLMK